MVSPNCKVVQDAFIEYKRKFLLMMYANQDVATSAAKEAQIHSRRRGPPICSTSRSYHTVSAPSHYLQAGRTQSGEDTAKSG